MTNENPLIEMLYGPRKTPREEMLVAVGTLTVSILYSLGTLVKDRASAQWHKSQVNNLEDEANE